MHQSASWLANLTRYLDCCTAIAVPRIKIAVVHSGLLQISKYSLLSIAEAMSYLRTVIQSGFVAQFLQYLRKETIVFVEPLRTKSLIFRNLGVVEKYQAHQIVKLSHLGSIADLSIHQIEMSMKFVIDYYFIGYLQTNQHSVFKSSLRTMTAVAVRSHRISYSMCLSKRLLQTMIPVFRGPGLFANCLQTGQNLTIQFNCLIHPCLLMMVRMNFSLAGKDRYVQFLKQRLLFSSQQLNQKHRNYYSDPEKHFQIVFGPGLYRAPEPLS